MSDQKQKNKLKIGLFVLIILVAAFGALLFFKLTSSGGAETCDSLRAQYDSAKAVEDYAKVSEAFSKMNALGCK